MPTTIRFLLPMALVLYATAARAEVPASTPEPAPAASTAASTGYRHQVIIADALAYGQVATAALAEGPQGADTAASDLLLTTGLGTFLLGAPIVHAAHGRWGRGLLSLGARVVLPIVGANVGFAMASCTRDEFLCGLGEAAAGLAVGGLAASVVDAAFIVPSAGDQPPAERPRTGPALAPRIVATPGLAMVGLGGRF